MKYHSRIDSPLALSVLTAMLSGCAGTPSRVSTDVEMPQGFTATGTDSLPDLWWESFDDPHLTTLIEIALAGNPTLGSARDRLDQAAAEARAAGVSQWPTLDADVGAARSGVGTTTAASDQSDWSTTLSLGLQASYEVDLWGRVGKTADAASLAVVATAEDLDILTGQLEVDSQTLKIVTAQFRIGQVGATDVLQQRQLVESSRGDLVLSEATGVPADLVQRRPDLRAGFARILAADASAATAVANRFPRLNITASSSADAADVGGLFTDGSNPGVG